MKTKLYENWNSLGTLFQGGLISLLLSVAAYCFTLDPLAISPILGYLVAYLLVHRIDILFYILLFTLPLSVTLDISPSLTLEFPDEPIMWALTPAIILLVLSRPQLLPVEFINSRIVSLLLLLYIWSLITLFTTTDLLPSVKYIAAKSWFLLSFFVLAFLVFRSYRNVRLGFFIFLFSFTAFLFYTIRKQYQNGFDFEKVNEAVMPLYHNHVTFSVTLSILIPMLVFWFFSTDNWPQKIVAAGMTLLFVVSLYYSYGRGAWLALSLAAGSYFIFRLRLIKPAVLLTFLFWGYSVYWLAQDYRYVQYRPDFEKTVMNDNLADHLMATFRGRDVSSMERVHRWVGSLNMVPDYPVFGVGPNNFYENYRYYTISSFQTWVSRNMERSTSHNYFLLMLSEQGLPGMLLYALLIFVSLAYAQNIYFKSDHRIIRGLAITLGCSLVAFYANNFLSELIESDELGSVFYMMLAILIVLDLHVRGVLRFVEEEHKSDFSPKI